LLFLSGDGDDCDGDCDGDGDDCDDSYKSDYHNDDDYDDVVVDDNDALYLSLSFYILFDFDLYVPIYPSVHIRILSSWH